MLRIITTILILINTVTTHSLFAQQQTTVFKGWIDDEFYKGTQTAIEGENKTVKISAKTNKKEPYTAKKHRKEVQDSLPEGFYISWNTERTKNYEQVILIKENNLYHFEKSGSVLKQITSNPSKEENPTFSPDGKKIAFTRGGNLYSLDLESGLERMHSNDGSDVVYNGYASWVYYEEILGRQSRYKAFWWSPDSKKIAFLRFDDSPVPIFSIFRSSGVHGELEQMHYPKVGDPNPLVKLGIVNTINNKTTWVATDEKTDQYIAWPFWTKDSKKLLFQQMTRDQNKIELMLTDSEDGSFTKIYEEMRPTWVEFFEDIHMMDDGSGFILRSYKNDWRNLYYYDFSGKLKTQITNVKWRVSSIEKVLEKQEKIFFKGSGENCTDEHLFSANLDGSNFKQHTQGAGIHQTYLSASGSYFTDIHESHSKVPSTIIIHAADNSKTILDPGKQKEYDSRTDHKTELFRVRSKDGKFDLPVKWTLPPNFKKKKKYPVVFTIYGGPDAGGLNDWWNGYDGNTLSKMDIITVTVAHRGSGKFGKAGLDFMHRNLGKWEIEDYIAVVEWLKKQSFVDPDRIGITGSSYGGYLSALALTSAADHFTHGIANLSVMDWQLYDNVYTERYMDSYKQNQEGYEQGSVLTHVDKFKGKLLLTHGFMDDNVHVQNSIQFVDKMQDAGKTFEMMFYPNERHGWGGEKRTHSQKLKKDFWQRHFFEKK